MTEISNTLPYHIAIIPDGNRRWAKNKKLPSILGHKKGFDRAMEIIDVCYDLGVKVITLYGFSTENWNRAKDEVDYLAKLFVNFFDKNIEKFRKRGIKLIHLGEISRFSPDFQQRIKNGVAQTKNNSKMTVQLALNYGGRDEIRRAIQSIVEKGIKPEEISEETIRNALDSKDTPDPDLIIRTSGEERLSGFLLWQSAYAELYFRDINWPDFTKTELKKAIDEFAHRQRRFGK